MTTALDDDEVKLEIVRMYNDGVTKAELSEIYGIPRTTLRDFVNGKTHKKWWQEFEKNPFGGEIADHHEDIRELKHSRFIITSAQNNTFVHTEFLDSLINMSEQIDAEIIVGTFSYNMRGFQNLEKGEANWFDSRITPYILDEPARLAPDLIWCGELNILPTAVNPLSGLYSYTKNCSGIFPHAKMQMESVPTHKQSDPKLLYTTGTVTKRNYIQKKAGQKASFHHIFGALIVEVNRKTGEWFVRQLSCDDKDGSVQDLDTIYYPDGSVERNKAVEAITWGDIHAEKLDEAVGIASFFGKDSMLNVLKPKYQFVHDVIDFTAKNHHNREDPYFKFRTYVQGRQSVRSNIQDAAGVLGLLERPYCTTYVVESNHDLAFKRWLKETDYRDDPVNAVFFLKCQLRSYEAIEVNEDFSIFEWAIREVDSTLNKTHFLKTDESVEILGIECGMHGDLGSNGAKGTANAFKHIDSRVNIGHSHSAKIIDGVYQAGHCMNIDKVDYAKGLSSWSHSHIIIYPNSKRTIVTLKNGKWRL